jgi:hypothetical protein
MDQGLIQAHTTATRAACMRMTTARLRPCMTAWSRPQAFGAAPRETQGPWHMRRSSRCWPA